MKFYFIVKVLFVLKIFKFLSWLFGHLDNHFHNILRLFDVLPNFLFTTSETMRNYYLPTGYTLEFYLELPNSLAASHRTKMKSKIMQKMRQGDEPQTPPPPSETSPRPTPKKAPRKATARPHHTPIALKSAHNKNKLHENLDYWSRVTLSPDPLKKGLGIVSPPHFVYDFSTKMFLMLYSIN